MRSRRQRRHTNGLTRGEPCARLGAAAVDPNLAGAQQFLEPAVRQVGVVAPEPAVEPHAVLTGLDRPHLDWRSLRHGPSGKWKCASAIGLDRCQFRVTLRLTGLKGMES